MQVLYLVLFEMVFVFGFTECLLGLLKMFSEFFS